MTRENHLKICKSGIKKMRMCIALLANCCKSWAEKDLSTPPTLLSSLFSFYLFIYS